MVNYWRALVLEPRFSICQMVVEVEWEPMVLEAPGVPVEQHQVLMYEFVRPLNS